MDIKAVPATTKLATSAKAIAIETAPAPTVGTDALTLTQVNEPQYFGHAPKVTLSMFMKQPIWADDRTDITSEQWHQMPASQQQAILKQIPSEPARKQFLSGIDPAVVEAKAYLGKLGKRLAQAIEDGAGAIEAKQAAQVDRLNALVDASEQK